MTVVAVKLPDASRRAIALGVFASVALFAADAPPATVAALWPPTPATTFEPWIPVTSPARLPVKPGADPAVVAEVALVAVAAFPARLPAIVPAMKFPDASRRTIVFGAFALVAVFAIDAPPATLAALWPPTLPTMVAPWVPVTSPARPAVKLVADPAVVAVVAVVASPERAAVIVPAVRLPAPSRRTMVFGAFAFVAEFAAMAPLATFAAGSLPTFATTVAACDPVTSPPSVPVNVVDELADVALPARSAVIVPAAKFPDVSRRTIVLAVLASVAAFAAVAPAATFAALWPPMFASTVALCVPVTSPPRLPVKLAAVVAVVAVIAVVAEAADVADVAVVALPDRFPVIVPATKSPAPSRRTIAFATFAPVALFAAAVPLATLPAL